MTDNIQKQKWWKKLLSGFIKSPINWLFVIFASYYGFLAFILESRPWFNKTIFWAIIAVWILWFFLKNMLKLVLLLAVVGACFYGYYRFDNREKIACVEKGMVWNNQAESCEKKVGLRQKVQNIWYEYWNVTEEDNTSIEKH